MRVYKTQHQYYCGVDLHARSLFANVLDDKGTTRLERDLPASPAAFLDAGKCDGTTREAVQRFSFSVKSAGHESGSALLFE